MNLKKKRFSIIIPNLNGGQYIEQAILSVLEQNYPNFEIIVMDGGSTDSSVEIIKKYESHLAYWESTPDRGQAHAINKGLEKATGDLFDWLNSDDIIAPDTFWKVANAFDQNPDAYVVCGKMTHFGENDFRKPVRMRAFPEIEKSILFGSMSGPSMYFRLDKFKEVGPLEKRLHFCFDLEFWCRFLERYDQKRLHFIDDNLCFFRLHPASKSVNYYDSFSEDQYLIFRSILHSVKKEEPFALSPEKLNISENYERDWSFTDIDPILFKALFLQKIIERLHQRITFLSIVRLYFQSLIISPINRGVPFYTIPLRAFRWKLLDKFGLYKTWVSDHQASLEKE